MQQHHVRPTLATKTRGTRHCTPETRAAASPHHWLGSVSAKKLAVKMVVQLLLNLCSEDLDIFTPLLDLF